MQNQCQTGLPQALHAQLHAYKRLLEPKEILIAVFFWKTGVDAAPRLRNNTRALVTGMMVMQTIAAVA